MVRTKRPPSYRMSFLRFLSRAKRMREIRFLVFLILGFLILTELVLRIMGIVLYPLIDEEVAKLNTQNAFRILCIGDSHTEGVDAAQGYSYPEQLAGLLNENTQKNFYVVANAGVSGANSSEVLIRLKRWLSESATTPDLVIVCIGRNNDHNFRNARFWKEKTLASGMLPQPILQLLEHSKLYRLGKIAVYNVEQAIQSKEDLFSDTAIRDREFLMSWLLPDYEEMVHIVRRTGAEIVFLNYFLPSPLVDECIEIVSKKHDVHWVDVRHFGLPLGLIWKLTGKTTHPNARGYSVIARRIYEVFLDFNLIPDTEGYVQATVRYDVKAGMLPEFHAEKQGVPKE